MEQDKIETELEKTEELEPVDAQIETEIERVKKKRREAIFELALFFILGVLIGITVKTEAVKKITIGFNDYQIAKPVPSYDVAALKKNLDDQMAQQQAEQQTQDQTQGDPSQDPSQVQGQAPAGQSQAQPQ